MIDDGKTFCAGRGVSAGCARASQSASINFAAAGVYVAFTVIESDYRDGVVAAVIRAGTEIRLLYPPLVRPRAN